MPLSWRARRQLTFLGIFALAVILIVAGVVYWLRPAPSCFDKKQNQSEAGVDCGGPCESCLDRAQDLVIFWTRFFPIAPGHWEVASFVENPNLLLGSGKLTYRLRLYDQNNILIALQERKTFVNPREKFLIYEPDVQTLQRIPVRATIEFLDIPWKRVERERPQLLVARKDFFAQGGTTSGGENFSRLDASIQNQSLFPVKNVFVFAVLSDKNGNALGVSVSQIDKIDGEAAREVVFTWRQPFDPPPETIEVLARTNLTE